MPPVVLEISELLRNPIRSGIQRVVRELLRYWPSDVPMCLACFDRDLGLVTVSDRVLPLLTEETAEIRELPFDELKSKLDTELRQLRAAPPKDADVFVPEVFFDHARCVFYRERLRGYPRRTAFLIYDLIPWLYSHHFESRGVAHLMPYLSLIRDASKTAFISSRTREEYLRRILRGRAGGGPVVPLGADGLGLERQHFMTERRSFAVIGSIDGRKNQDRIVAAFIGLWQQGVDIPLVLIGRAFEHIDRRCFEQAATFTQFTWLENASDEVIKRVMRTARATIYVSEVEGYGIPPVESLHAGIPVIASAGVPSLFDLPAKGQLRLEGSEPDRIAAAVLQVYDDETAARLWQDAKGLQLPSWRECARQAAEWMVHG